MNKLMSRIVAVVMAIAMLGTVSFAGGYNADTGMINSDIKDNSNDNNETLLVYASATAGAPFANGDVIVAVKQGADVSGTIAVDKNKVAEAQADGKNYLNIALGGKNGNVSISSVFLSGNIEVASVEVEDEYKAEDGKIYTNVAYAKFEMPTDGRLSKCGVKFVSNAIGAKPIYVEKVFDIPVMIKGIVSFEALVVSVPYETMIGDEIIATPYFEYAKHVDTLDSDVNLDALKTELDNKDYAAYKTYADGSRDW